MFTQRILFWKVQSSHTSFFCQCPHTQDIFPEKINVLTLGFLTEKINVSTPGKFNVHTLQSFNFLKKSMFTHRFFPEKLNVPHQETSMFTDQRVSISWKIQCSHTVFLTFFLKSQCSTPGKFNVHTPVSYDFLKTSMCTYRDLFFWKINVFHTRKIQCSHTGISNWKNQCFHTRKIQCSHTGIFFWKSMFLTPGKFIVEVPVFFFLKNQCFHTRKIQRSHTSKLWFPEKINVHTPGFFSEKSMFPHQENSTFTHRDFSPLHPKKSMSSHTEKKFQTKRNAKKINVFHGENSAEGGKKIFICG